VRTASRLLKKTPGRLDFQRGVLQRTAEGELEVTTTGHQGSHIFSSFSQGNCFIVLERDRVTLRPANGLKSSRLTHCLEACQWRKLSGQGDDALSPAIISARLISKIPGSAQDARVQITERWGTADYAATLILHTKRWRRH
jgi:hypothetical protein